MGTATVAIWTTEEMHNTDPNAIPKIKLYLAESFAETSHTLQTVATSFHPDPPTEQVNDSPTDTVCGNSERDYSNLMHWWYDYHRCQNLKDAADANLLVTNASNLGGKGDIGGDVCVSAGAQISQLPYGETVDTHESSPPTDAMQTAIHEIGHNLGLIHPDGYHSVDGDDYYQTYMMHDYSTPLEGDDNSCGEYLVDDTDSMNKHNDFSWSDCAETKMSL